jgi:hypothetical protein
VKYLLLEDGTKVYQREGFLAPYRRGKGRQELYWLIDGAWAVSPRTIYYDKKGEAIADYVELFKAFPDERYACGYRFEFKHTANSLKGLKDVCWKLLADFPLLVGVAEALEGFGFEERDTIDLSYCGKARGTES